MARKKKEIKEAWAVIPEDDGKVHVRPTINGKIIDTPIEEVIKPEDIEIMALDNKPIARDVTKEPIQVHDKFVSVPPIKVETKKTINVRNGRVYKNLGNGYGMYSDTGETFRI